MRLSARSIRSPPLAGPLRRSCSLTVSYTIPQKNGQNGFACNAVALVAKAIDGILNDEGSSILLLLTPCKTNHRHEERIFKRKRSMLKSQRRRTETTVDELRCCPSIVAFSSWRENGASGTVCISNRLPVKSRRVVTSPFESLATERYGTRCRPLL